MTAETKQTDPLERPTMSVEEAGQLLGVSRCSAYRAANTGQLPVIKVGKSLRVPSAAVRRMLHLEEPQVTP
jgi:excisionase family DNA binding protein